MRTAVLVFLVIGAVVVIGAWLLVRPLTKPPAAVTAAEAAVPERVRMLCLNCHVIDGRGGTQGPALDGIGRRMTPEQIATWIRNPQAVKPGTAMPNLGLSTAEREAVVAWLAEKR